ncbi:MAG: FeoB-associated Cys-rich membrane protein [Treponema sp.]|nr:FeoB-associated Cys-rich membrane protein [Treponema sp.]
MLGTIIVSLLLVLAVAGIIVSLVKKARGGGGCSCGCGCSCSGGRSSAGKGKSCCH